MAWMYTPKPCAILIRMYSGTPPYGHPWNADIHGNADTACGPESKRILNHLWNKHTPLIKTLWKGPKGVRIIARRYTLVETA